MKEKVAPSSGSLFFQSSSVIYMEGTGLHVDEPFPQGTYPRLCWSWSASQLLSSGVSILMDNIEGLGAPVLQELKRFCFLPTLAMLPNSSKLFHHLASWDPPTPPFSMDSQFILFIRKATSLLK